jgi:mannose-6-phosphate isomerase-like protein (cupin superfamily)
MQQFSLAELVAQRQASNHPWLEFLRTDSLSMGLYELAAGSKDPQQPHSEDEVYYVVAGEGQLEVAGVSQPVQAGSIVYVPKRVPHHFHSIQQDLRILVFFAPAEYSLASQA